MKQNSKLRTILQFRLIIVLLMGLTVGCVMERPMSVNVFTIKNKTSYDNINSSSDNIAIIGLTSNCKAGATIVSAHEQKRYYLDGIDYWEDTLVGKTIKVSGRLVIEDLREETVNEGEIIPQQMIGIKRTILNPAWEIMK